MSFLYGDLEEKIYMEQPEGLKSAGKENLACLLKKVFMVSNKHQNNGTKDFILS